MKTEIIVKSKSKHGHDIALILSYEEGDKCYQGFWLSTDGGEGMKISEQALYDLLSDFYDKHF